MIAIPDPMPSNCMTLIVAPATAPTCPKRVGALIERQLVQASVKRRKSVQCARKQKNGRTVQLHPAKTDRGRQHLAFPNTSNGLVPSPYSVDRVAGASFLRRRSSSLRLAHKR